MSVFPGDILRRWRRRRAGGADVSDALPRRRAHPPPPDAALTLLDLLHREGRASRDAMLTEILKYSEHADGNMALGILNGTRCRLWFFSARIVRIVFGYR